MSTSINRWTASRKGWHSKEQHAERHTGMIGVSALCPLARQERVAGQGERIQLAREAGPTLQKAYLPGKVLTH